MSENKHTPGPWDYAPCINFGHKCFQIHQKDGAPYTPYYSDVATTERGENAEIQEANARLISAAPDLLKALKMLYQWVRAEVEQFEAAEPDDEIIEAVEAAIKKAEEVAE